MSFWSYYYLFSVATFFIIALYIWNVAYYKRNLKNLLGMTFKKDTIEYKRMQKAATQSYIGLSIVALLFTSLNLVLSVHDVLQSHDGKVAALIFVTHTFIVLTVIISVSLATRSVYGSNKNKQSKKIKKTDTDEDW